MPALDPARAERRLAAVRDEVVRRGLDALIVGDLVRPGDSNRDSIANVSWLTGFDGTSAFVLVTSAGGGRFLTDFRYAERARAEVAGAFDVAIASGRLVPELAKLLSGRIGFDPGSTSVRMHERLGEEAPGVELVAVPGVVEESETGEGRGVRSPGSRPPPSWATRSTPRSSATGLPCGASATSPTRSNRRSGRWGPRRRPSRRSSRRAPTAPCRMRSPSEREIREGELVVIDLGVVLDGYCSDCTRTYAAGRAPEEDAAEAYEVVRSAQARALSGDPRRASTASRPTCSPAR